MTQPPNPGQPYIPPSAGSAPGSYNMQQPTQYQAAQPGQPQPGPFQQASYAGAQYAQAPAVRTGSLMSSLFDGVSDFASKHGKTIFTIGFVANLVMWVSNAINGGLFTFMSGIDDVSNHFDFLTFLRSLFIGGGVQGTGSYLGIAQFVFNILILRLIIEIAAKIGSPKSGTPAA